MQPKRLLSITQDDELHRHLDHLSEDEHEEVNRVLGPALYNSERAISQNLALAVEQGKLPVKDMVNLPPHYARFPIEPIRFAVENGLNFLQGNAVKYILRYDAKNGVEDLRKAIRNIEMLIKFVEQDPDWWKRPTPKAAI